MREIKVRGYATEEMVNSQWLYGFGVRYESTIYGTVEAWLYTESGPYQVYPESVGECTNLPDKNSKEIYEGDILKARIRCGYDMAKCDYEYKYKNYAVEYWQSFVSIGYRIRNKNRAFMIKPSSLHTMQVEVIGNIYDNPELLKESE